MHMTSELIKVEITDSCILLILNQPETYNAFSKEMIIALSNHIKSSKNLQPIKPLIITGSGKAFSSGGNLGVMKEYIEQGKSVEYIQSIVPYVNDLISELLEYPGPTLAIVNGSAVGGGFNVAMACDFRIVYEKAKFRLGFIDIGLTPATGNSFFVPKVIGIQRTMELSLFSEVITAQDLYNWGLANEIYSNDSFEQVKDKWLTKMSTLDPWQVTTVRKLLYAGMNNSYSQQLNLEYETLQEASQRDLFKHRVITRWNELQSHASKK